MVVLSVINQLPGSEFVLNEWWEHMAVFIVFLTVSKRNISI